MTTPLLARDRGAAWRPSRLALIAFVALSLRGAAGAAPRAHAQATPGPGLCAVTGAQTASDETIEVGQSVGLTISFAATCPVEMRGRADIVLLVDNSGSMQDAGKSDAARAAVRTFLGNVDFARHRVGIVPFSDRAYVLQTLTTRRDRLASAIDDMEPPNGGTDIAAAILAAGRELESSGRSDAVGILVLLTDGLSEQSAMFAAAQAMRLAGRALFVIGLGADVAGSTLRLVATTPDDYYFAPGPADLAEIYDRIATLVLQFTVMDVAIVDQPSHDVAYVRGSALPDQPDTESGLRWRRAFLPNARRYEISYRVTIDRVGQVQPSEAVWIEYVDADGARRRTQVTPATLTVTPKEIHRAYLPAAYRDQCIEATSWADVVLVIDVSDSMKGQKLADAVAAAQTFAALLRLPGDQAAVVAYDGHARTVQPLTIDRQAIHDALAGLVTGSGTRIDLGLAQAIDELAGPFRRADNRAVLIVLSDGKQVEARDQVAAIASQARHMGITAFTIALGADADHDMLESIATDASRAYVAPRSADLADIYARIAAVVGCR